MPQFEVTVTQRDTAPVDAAAATKCKCKCDGQLDPAAVRQALAAQKCKCKCTAPPLGPWAESGSSQLSPLGD